MASITPTKENTYRVQIRKRGFASVSQTFVKKSDAVRWAAVTEAAMVTGKHLDQSKAARSTTVGDLFLRRLDELPENEENHQQRIKLTSLYKSCKFMDRHLDQICTADLQRWREARLAVAKPGTVKREMGTISGLFNHAMREWQIPLSKNPITGLAKPEGGDVVRTRGWMDWEIEAVMNAANVNLELKPALLKDYCGWAIALAVETAMRKGELLKALAGDYHPKEKRLFLRDNKNDHDRDVALSKKAIRLLDVLTDGLKPEDRIFPLSSSHLHNSFVAAKAAAGLKDKTLLLHGGRHEATTRTVGKVSNLFELMAFTGHRDPKSAKRYYHPKPATIADKLD